MAVWHFAIERVPNKEGELYEFTQDWEKDKEKFIYHWIPWNRNVRTGITTVSSSQTKKMSF